MQERNTNSNVWLSAIATAVLVGGGGVGYRLLAAEYARAALSVPIPAGTLATLPLEIGVWIGTEQELDKRIVEATDTDDHLNRTYHRGRDTVGLFVGYGVSLRDLAPHRPEVCYPGAGWLLDETHEVELDADSDFSAQVHQFFKGGLAADRVTVLNYYLVDGTYCPNVSLLRSRAWQREGQATFAAQVQIVCGGAMNPAEAEERVRAFAKASGPLIRDLLISAVEKSLSATR